MVKGFTGEQHETLAFQQAIDRSRQSRIRSQRYYVLQKVFADLLISLGIILLMLFGACQAIKNKLRPGNFIAFFPYVKKLKHTGVAVKIEDSRSEPMSAGEKCAAMQHDLRATNHVVRAASPRDFWHWTDLFWYALTLLLAAWRNRPHCESYALTLGETLL